MNEQINKLRQEQIRIGLELDRLTKAEHDKLNKTGDFIESLKQTFESSSQETEQFGAFTRLFKKDFTKILSSLGATQIEISKNHFEVYGFFTHHNQAYYFNLGDLRWNKKDMLIRTAQNYKDWTGGHNNFLRVDNRTNFISDLRMMINA